LAPLLAVVGAGMDAFVEKRPRISKGFAQSPAPPTHRDGESFL